jgi:hypothetical protein
MEKIKVALLAGIFCILLWMAVHPRPQAGRFIAQDNDPMEEMWLDTATGQPCMVWWARDHAPKDVRVCSDLR